VIHVYKDNQRHQAIHKVEYTQVPEMIHCNEQDQWQKVKSSPARHPLFVSDPPKQRQPFGPSDPKYLNNQ
jgi:hypothetical protein